MLTTVVDTGPLLTDEVIGNLESALGYELPQEYRSFLKKYNGGAPKESAVLFDSKKLGIHGSTIGYFYGVGTGSEDVLKMTKTLSGSIPIGMIPIADTPDGNYFLMSLRNDSFAKIYYFDHEVEPRLPFEPARSLPDNMEIVAPTFGEFLGQLQDLDE
jgi:hypothetical protein